MSKYDGEPGLKSKRRDVEWSLLGEMDIVRALGTILLLGLFILWLYVHFRGPQPSLEPSSGTSSGSSSLYIGGYSEWPPKETEQVTPSVYPLTRPDLFDNELANEELTSLGK